MKDRVKSVLNYKKPAFWIIVVAILASIIAAVCLLTNPVSKDEENENFTEGSLLYDLGAISIESIESCSLIDRVVIDEVYIGKEDFNVLAKYRYIEDLNSEDKIKEVLRSEDNQRINICINDSQFILYLLVDGRIVVEVSRIYKVYQADENNRITHEKYEELVRKYNPIGAIFRVGDSQTQYKAIVTYNPKDPQLAETVVICEEKSGLQLQTIDLPENECFTPKPLYMLDVNFDGDLDILVPSQRTASAVYFQAYVWNERARQFLYAPAFENLPNFALDTKNKLILFSRSTSMINSYGMSYYNATLKDFIFKNSVYMELAENNQEIHFVEEKFKNKEWEIIEEYFIAGDDLYGLDKTNPVISYYYEKGSYWDLDSEKWDCYLVLDSNKFEVTDPDQLYKQFLNGEIAAHENGQEKFLKDYFTVYSGDDSYYRYTFVDMNKDGIEELCIKTTKMYFFIIGNGKLNHWRTEENTYTDILSNGALFYERDVSAPQHIDYQYYELYENGSISFKITFAWYDGTTVEEGKEYREMFLINNNEVTKEEYEEKTKEYMMLSEDRVTWNDGYLRIVD